MRMEKVGYCSNITEKLKDNTNVDITKNSKAK